MDSRLSSLLDAPDVALLERYNFDREAFFRLKERLEAHGIAGFKNEVAGSLRPPAPEDTPPTPPLGSAAREHLAEVGRLAIRRGEVAAVVLNGGMATRFGGVVKAAVEVFPGRSFLDLKLSDLRASGRASGGTIPVVLMNSFATDAGTKELLAGLGAQDTVETFTQSVSIRLTPKGEIFRDAEGHVSPYAPGHGDLVDALRPRVLPALVARGVRHLVLSNVDNLAANIDPVVLGIHIERSAEMTVDVVRKNPEDKGGAPAWHDGRLEIIEAFRFPADFDQGRIPVFNTNTFLFDLSALDRPFPLDWFAVEKTVEGKTAVQFERLAGQLTAFLRSVYVEVPRTGPLSRFLPVKDPTELERRRPEIRAVLEARGVL